MFSTVQCPPPLCLQGTSTTHALPCMKNTTGLDNRHEQAICFVVSETKHMAFVTLIDKHAINLGFPQN